MTSLVQSSLIPLSDFFLVVTVSRDRETYLFVLYTAHVLCVKVNLRKGFISLL